MSEAAIHVIVDGSLRGCAHLQEGLAALAGELELSIQFVSAGVAVQADRGQDREQDPRAAPFGDVGGDVGGDAGGAPRVPARVWVRDVVDVRRRLLTCTAARVVVLGGASLRASVIGALLAIDPGRRPELGLVTGAARHQLADARGPELRRALRTASLGRAEPMDVARWLDRAGSLASTPRWFLGSLRGGALREASGGAPPRSQPRSRLAMAGLAYGVAGMLGLPAMRPAQLDLRGPGFAWAGLAYALAIANGPERRGSVRLCPGASASDGALDITIVPAHLELGQVLELIDEGSVATLADVARFRSPWIELRARPALVLEVAGERRRCAHARFDLAPTALAVAAAELGPTPTQSARAGSG